MESQLAGIPAGRVYALVSYIPGPLGDFLNCMRADLVPSCRLLSHITFLPPRTLRSPEPALVQALDERLPLIKPFEIGLEEVEVFERTQVVYLSLGGGVDTVKAIHDRLGQDLLAFDEPHEFHPHITLAQEIANREFGDVLEEAKRRWKQWNGPRSFLVNEMVFVRNRDANHWDSIAEHKLTLSTTVEPSQGIHLLRTA